MKFRSRHNKIRRLETEIGLAEITERGRYRLGMPNVPPSPTKLAISRGTLADVLIVIVVVVFALDMMPCTPAVIRRGLSPLLNVTGLWQGTWNLFAPVPDFRNHRIRADFYFADGSHRVWTSPDPRSQSAWKRFVGHRESEFLEKVWEDDNSAARPGFAQLLVKEQRRLHPDDGPLSRVELSVIWGDIPPPSEAWQPVEKAISLDQERVFFTLIYPE